MKTKAQSHERRRETNKPNMRWGGGRVVPSGMDHQSTPAVAYCRAFQQSLKCGFMCISFYPSRFSPGIFSQCSLATWALALLRRGGPGSRHDIRIATISCTFIETETIQILLLAGGPADDAPLASLSCHPHARYRLDYGQC